MLPSAAPPRSRAGKEVHHASMKPPKGYKRMNINVDTKLHNAFKAITAQQGKNMSDVLVQFIKEYIEKNQPSTAASKGGRS